MGTQNQKRHKPLRALPAGLAVLIPQKASVSGQVESSSDAPMVITGSTNIPTESTPRGTASDRYRLSVDLSPVVSAHLDHISGVTGQTRSAIIGNALLDSLPALIARADGLRSRYHELANGKP